MQSGNNPERPFGTAFSAPLTCEALSTAELLEVALDSAGMGSWELYLSTGAMHRTLRHDQIFGYAEIQPFWDLNMTFEHIVAEDQQSVRRAFSQAVVEGSIYVEARICQGPGHDIRWIHLSGRTFYREGLPTRIAGVIADITHRRAVEDRLRAAQKIEALGQLTGGVAHDFNNLLQVISSGLQIIARQSDPKRREKIFTSMQQAVDRGANLCRQLLTFSRCQTLKPQVIDLRQLIGDMRELLNRSLRADVKIHTSLKDELWCVEADRGELELIILNLALNARDAMPAGGTIEISAVNCAALADHELNGDFVRLDIADSGIGMSPDTLGRAFEPFFTTKEVGSGSGLGLSQAHGFAKASGGIVRIASTPGSGTSVSVFLPRTLKKPAAVAESILPARDEALGPRQVLVVEDDDEVAALTVEMIHQLGYETTRVASAEAALGALADRRSVDIVFSDVMMPGRMNGVELAQEIRRRRPNLPVLLTSGHAEAARRHAGGQPIDIIPKPYRLDELRDALAAVRQYEGRSFREH
jgi:signal transduction histidine kinase/ActR/RegA family two-component response regulator